jgi:hypothetical protein
MPPKREEKEIKKDIESRETIELATFFGDAGNLSFLVKKSERISAGIYLITNLFSDNEPVKWSLRQDSMEVVGKVSLLGGKVS